MDAFLFTFQRHDGTTRELDREESIIIALLLCDPVVDKHLTPAGKAVRTMLAEGLIKTGAITEELVDIASRIAVSKGRGGMIEMRGGAEG